jgi:hypothetical protein
MSESIIELESSRLGNSPAMCPKAHRLAITSSGSYVEIFLLRQANRVAEHIPSASRMVSQACLGT